jgi:hypothetical protein
LSLSAGESSFIGRKRAEMQRRVIGIVLVAVAAVGLGVGLSMSGAATGTPYQPAGISVKPTSPAPGASAIVTAAGFKPGGSVTVIISNSRCQPGSCAGQKVFFTSLGRVRANANGIAIDRVTIPKKFALGSQHTVEARGVSDHGSARTESTTITLSRHRSTGH